MTVRDRHRAAGAIKGRHDGIGRAQIDADDRFRSLGHGDLPWIHRLPFWASFFPQRAP